MAEALLPKDPSQAPAADTKSNSWGRESWGWRWVSQYAGPGRSLKAHELVRVGSVELASKNVAVGDGARPGEKEWWSDYWLAATSDEINFEEIREKWNGEETPTLRLLQESAPQIELGPLYADGLDHFDVGPARRIFNPALLARNHPGYVLPVVSDALVAEIVAAGHPWGDDQVGSASAPDAIETFLTEYKGWNLLPFERRAE
jgi:hypothetical protein